MRDTLANPGQGNTRVGSALNPPTPQVPSMLKDTGRSLSGRPQVLVVSPVTEDRRFLRSVFESIDWLFDEVGTCRQACDFLRTHRPNVIVCDWDLTDGSWREILSEIAPLPNPPSLLVVSVVEESRWAEVLNLGAYDLLAKPLNRTEVLRIASLASLHSAQNGTKNSTAATAPQ